MAVLSGGAGAGAGGGSDGLLPGAARVLATRDPLPQPDQLCGPYAARAALGAVLDEPPSLVDLAGAAGTRVWPHDEPRWRPAGAPLLRTGWDRLPTASTPGASGTDAAPLAAALPGVAGIEVVAVPAAGRADPGPWGALLDRLREQGEPVGVVANLRTGPTWPAGHPLAGWDVGHFVVVLSWDGTEVGVADSYAETGAPGWPPGCRGVPLPALVAGLSAPPGRGLLLLVRPGGGPAVRDLVARAGLTTDDRVW